jgi:hypothetical protein
MDNPIISYILNEALKPAQRAKRARAMKLAAPKIKRGREKAARKTATTEVLMKRATKAARSAVEKKILAGKSKADLTFSGREALEKKVEKKKSAIQKIAKKLLPKMKKAEIERKKSASSSED